MENIKYIKSARKRFLIFMLAVIVGFCTAFAGTWMIKPVVAAADDTVLYTGYIPSGTTDVNIRTSTDTSDYSNVIACVIGVFNLDIYGTEYTSSNYAWYDIGFYLDGEYRRGYIAAEFVVVNDDGGDGDDGGYTEDADFEEYMDNQGFPETYKDGLRELHAQYPKWVFVADHTGVDWDYLVEQQNVVGRSLVHMNDPDSWKSTESGCYDWSTGKYHMYDGYWSQASSEVIEYMLDPRNFLNSTNVFMFESLAYNAKLQTISGIENIINDSFMNGSSHLNGTGYTYPTALMAAGRQSGVSPYHLATRIINELGRYNPSDIISGTVSGYEGYYNYYNISAVNGSNSATVNGLIYAMRTDASTLRPWNTRFKAIAGGAIFIGRDYINKGQSTLYYEKFDIKEFWHQYMTYIFAPKSESISASEAYTSSIKENTALVFTIPVYDNMPESVCELPEKNYGNVNNKLSDLSVDGYSLTPTFDLYNNNYDLIVENEVSGITVSGSLVDSLASVDGLGYHELEVGNNRIDIVVTAQSGAENVYTINVVRKEPDKPSGGDGFTTIYKLNEETKIISNIAVGSSAADIKNGFTCDSGVTVKVTDSNGSTVSGKVATGNVVTVYNSSDKELAKYTVVIYGDPTGDGEIDLFDIVKIKRYMLGTSSLSAGYLEAADCSHDGEVDLFDIVAIKRHMLGKAYITQ